MKKILKIISIILLLSGLSILLGGVILSSGGIGHYFDPVYSFFNDNFIGWIIIGALILLGVIGLIISNKLEERYQVSYWHSNPSTSNYTSYNDYTPSDDSYEDDYDDSSYDDDYQSDNDYTPLSDREIDYYSDPGIDYSSPYVTVEDADGNTHDINTISGYDEDGNHYSPDPFTDEWYED